MAAFPSDARPRWMGVGRSHDPDARTAGSRAAQHALAGPDPRLLLVFCSGSYDLPELIQAIADEAPGVPLVGCSTAGEISVSHDHAGAADATVVVTALGGPGFSVATRSARVEDDPEGGLRQAGFDASGCMADVEPLPHSVLMVLSDGLAGDQEEVVRGAYRAVGATVPLVGGCAGDDLKMTATFQFHGTEVLTNAVVAVAIASDAPLGIGVRHGWQRVGEPMVVTNSDGNRVFTLDDQPALDAYLARLGAPSEAHTDPAAFTRFALTHPLGISRRNGEEVRFVAEADFAERSLVCIANVAKGGLAWFMQGDEQSVLEATDAACGEALASLGEQPPLGMVAFDCIARRGVMGDCGIQREVDRLAGFAHGAPVAGFYTYGEFARTRGTTGFHNQTLVVLAVA
ncbi:MAG TPA: FIST N-terminal domain-containing protein [Acidimicrobiales bacterium]|nr:FIST N-terminal domain-containing protein [Acidimicrobiales bacterium]